MVKKGFTLLELIVVLIILGVLATIGMPPLTKAIERSRTTEAVSILHVLRGAQLRYAAEFGTTTDSMDNLDVDYTTLKHFDDPPILTAGVDPDTNDDLVIAQIRRNVTTAYGGRYTLYIRANGNITCTDQGGGTSRCVDLGFTANY